MNLFEDAHVTSASQFRRRRVQVPPFSSLSSPPSDLCQLGLCFPTESLIFLLAIALPIDDIEHVLARIWQEPKEINVSIASTNRKIYPNSLVATESTSNNHVEVIQLLMRMLAHQ
jgi:hypothetical protein